LPPARSQTFWRFSLVKGIKPLPRADRKVKRLGGVRRLVGRPAPGARPPAGAGPGLARLVRPPGHRPVLRRVLRLLRGGGGRRPGAARAARRAVDPGQPAAGRLTREALVNDFLKTTLGDLQRRLVKLEDRAASLHLVCTGLVELAEDCVRRLDGLETSL